jgi:YfiH family protein
MLERVEHENGVVTYQSPLLRRRGVVHAFTTRIGGVSRAPYDSLNLGVLSKGPDTDANTSVAENFRRVRAALGVEKHFRVEAHQVHEATVWEAPEKPVKWADAPCADAIITDQAGRLLCIRTADCVPILLATTDGRRVAAVHAGWRGLVAGVIEAAVGRFAQPPAAAIGPCISAAHFEVGDEVASRFPAGQVDRSREKPHVDLCGAAADRLRALGVNEIDTTDRCTYRDEAEYFSHRRDVTHRGKPDTGRMAALIAARG